MANNFKNSFVSVTSAGEYYQSDATDSINFIKLEIPQLIRWAIHV